MPCGSLAGLVGATCSVRGVRVGDVTGVVVDPDFIRVLGLDVHSVDGRRRFLPWVAAEQGPYGVDVDSAYLLVDAGDSYTRRGARCIREAAELSSRCADLHGRIARRKVVSIGLRAGTPDR